MFDYHAFFINDHINEMKETLGLWYGMVWYGMVWRACVAFKHNGTGAKSNDAQIDILFLAPHFRGGDQHMVKKCKLSLVVRFV
jgi:hypothetical protein